MLICAAKFLNSNKFLIPVHLLTITVPNMSQRSIRSFFTASSSKKVTNKQDGSSSENDSPVKSNHSKITRKRMISSSSEEGDNTKSTPSLCKKSPKFASPIKSTPDVNLQPLPEAFTNSKSPIKVASIFGKPPKVEQKDIKPPKIDVKFKASAETKLEKPSSTQACQNSSNYDPSARKYHPINDAYWRRGDKVPYSALAKTFELIEGTSGRLKTIETLSNFFRSVIVLSPDDFLACIYLCLNQFAPAYEGLELGIAEHTLMKAIAQSTGRSIAQIKADAATTGDLGVVAEKSRSSQKMMFTPAALTVQTVFTKLKEITMMKGTMSINKKVDKIQTIFIACKQAEARYFIRSLLGKLRIGLAEQSVIQAIAQACVTTPPNFDEYPPTILNALDGLSEVAAKEAIDKTTLIIKTTYCQCPNYGKIVPVLLKEGVDALQDKCKMDPGVPIKPMLAHPTKGVSEVLERLDGIDFTCEWKYDGERAQIHLSEDGVVSIFSRNQENNTSKYPDIIERMNLMKKSTALTSFIIDAEAVAWDCENKRILPFQVLSTRKRKDASIDSIKVQVCVYMFDLLYLNGRALVEEPLIERRRLLMENFQEQEGQWQFATRIDTSDTNELQSFLEDAIKGNCEGLMVKTLSKDATYEIAKRSRNWLKLKKDYMAGVGDSLDLVVLGAFVGKGKRTGTYGGFLLGCYDHENEEYQSICKIGTGFSDEDLQTHSEFFKGHIIDTPKSYYRFDASHVPDVWFPPLQVWEVKCADLSLSPVHRAGIGIIDPDKGISLRFPRFIRIRDDKKVEEATSAQQVAEMYSNQDQIKAQQKTSKGREDEEEFY